MKTIKRKIAQLVLEECYTRDEKKIKELRAAQKELHEQLRNKEKAKKQLYINAAAMYRYTAFHIKWDLQDINKEEN